MGEFSAKEIEMTDYIVNHINNEIFSTEQDVLDKSRLEYSLCTNDAERLKTTKKRIAKYKSKIDKCDPVIAGYLTELVRHNKKEIDNGELRDWLTRNFVVYHYQELIVELALNSIEEIEDYVFSSIVKSKGHSYKHIKKYIDGVCDIIHYTKYKSFLDLPSYQKEDYNSIVENLNNAYFRLEAFSVGTYEVYYHFDFAEAFSNLFRLTRISSNYTIDNCIRISQYWELNKKIKNDFEKNNFLNKSAKNNDDFKSDCNLLIDLNSERIGDFANFTTPNEFLKNDNSVSISDIIKIPILNKKTKSELKELTDDVPINSTYNENFSNDPLFDSKNGYNVLKDNFIKEYNSKKECIDLIFDTSYEKLKAEFDLWEMFQTQDLNEAFLKMIKELNHKKTFFFGCSFANYEYNYSIRLNLFLDNFYDATELEFINEELEFLENILYDLQNSVGAFDGYYNSSFANFNKANDVISITGFKQYLFSHNKKVEFLEIKKANFNVIKPIINKPIDLIEVETTNPHPQVFSNLKAFQLFEKLHIQFKDSNNKMADFSFIYRKMYNDSYISSHFKPQMFIEWINKEPFKINLDKIKTLNDCSTTQKVNTYTTTKELMQLT